MADHSDLNKVIIHGEIHVIEIEYSFGFKEAETGFYDPGFNNQVFYRVKDQPTFPDDTVDQLKQMENRLNTFIGNHSKVTVELI